VCDKTYSSKPSAKSTTCSRECNAERMRRLHASGVTYTCRNLHKWVRDNEHLFYGRFRQAYYGFVRLKGYAKKNRDMNISNWKGWKLLNYTEGDVENED